MCRTPYCAVYCVYMCALHRMAMAAQYRPDYSCERDRDPIGKSNKRSRISLQMFSLDMTAPSITTPHVRGRGMSMTQSKSHSHGRIYIGLFHSSTSLSLFSNASLLWLMPPFHSPPVPLSCFHLHFFFFFLTIEMSSLSSMEQGIRSQVVWFNTAVHSARQTTKMFA